MYFANNKINGMETISQYLLNFIQIVVFLICGYDVILRPMFFTFYRHKFYKISIYKYLLVLCDVVKYGLAIIF